MIDEDENVYSIEKEFDVAKVVMDSAKLAAQAGFNSSMQNKIATVVSELGKNILHHATKGSITLKIVLKENAKGIEVIAKDNGPGIENIDKALTDCYSTKKSLGLGLPAVKRIMDELYIDTDVGKGTQIITRKWFTDG